jgi:hypothetical protein
MNGIIEIGMVSTLILFLLAIDFILWMAGTVLLLGLLGWHPPGWLASPVAHAINTALAVVGGALAIAVPILLDMALKRAALL